MKILAVDPGKTGALFVIEDGVPKTCYDMPTTEVGSKTLPCPDKITEILTENNIALVAIEQVGASPRMGVSSAFNFGYSFGIVIGVCAGLLVPHYLITPQKWKTLQGLMKKDKDESRLKAIREYPELEDYFKYKKNCDRADAMWIGLSWYRLHGGK